MTMKKFPLMILTTAVPFGTYHAISHGLNSEPERDRGSITDIQQIPRQILKE